VSKSKTSKSKTKPVKATPKAAIQKKVIAKKAAPKATKAAFKKSAKPATKKIVPKAQKAIHLPVNVKKSIAPTKKTATAAKKSASPAKKSDTVAKKAPTNKATLKKAPVVVLKKASISAPAKGSKPAIKIAVKTAPLVKKSLPAPKTLPAKKVAVSSPAPALAKDEPIKVSTTLVVSSTGMPRIASLPSAPPPPPKATAKKQSSPQIVSEPIEPAKAPVISSEKASTVKSGALFYDSHMHTPLCKHAWGEPEEYCAQALKSGLKGIIFTCHCPMPDGYWPSVRMSDSEFDTYVAVVQRAANAYKGNLDVSLGLESEHFPGYEKWIENLHKRAPFDYILGAVHWQAKEYLNKFETGTIENFRRTYFDQLAASAETGLYDCLAHPDLVKNYHPDSWCFAIIKNSVIAALDRIAKTGVAMELNTSGLNKSYSEMNPGNEMLKMMAERKIPIVLGSDAHKPVRVGEHFITALNNLVEAGFENVSYFKKRQRIDVNISDVISSIKRATDANA
jgi:histidinol-phosphatase (PHP family)